MHVTTKTSREFRMRTLTENFYRERARGEFLTENVVKDIDRDRK